VSRGLVLGKFLPPHLGHVYLCEFAKSYVDELFVVVGTLRREPIPGALRHRWMSELVPGARVLHLDEELPQDPSEHPDFWRLWKEALLRVLPATPDFVFASESYGTPLAELFGATFVPVDLSRSAVPVSGTKIRSDPMRYWDYLPRCVRPHFARRVCVFGPESTGKSTLARDLAARFATVWVPEYARTHLEAQGGRIGPGDIPRIARGQRAAEEALARDANRVLILDTDLLETVIWSEVLFGSCPDEVRAEAERRTCDLYLLTDVDVPWVRDPVRYLPDERRSFFERCRRALEERKRPFVVVSGAWEKRLAEAAAAVATLVKPG
jgi:NadR type nicotinamide-nucleotide adenylyltransferase